VKYFVKCLAHDGTLERCVPLVPKVHAQSCLVLKLLKFSLYLILNEKFQYGHKDDLRKNNIQCGDLKAPGCLPYQSCNPPHSLEII
jgi:hypothetical protein